MGRTVSVKLLADVAQFTREMGGRATGAVKTLSGELDKAAKAGKLDAVAERAGFAGVALLGMAGYAVKASSDFEKSMSKVEAATHASSGEIDLLRKAALQAGKDTQYSATGAADAVTELSKAGVGTADILGGGLRGALSLAAAGQLDVGEAAETAASALTQFKLKGKDIPHVADLLAAAAGKAQGSVHDMGFALNQSGLVAAQFGLSIEDTTGVLAEFANAGLIGSDAGTSFKTMLLAIANPSNITSKLMANLGISFYDAQGRFVGLSGVAEVLRQRLGNLTDQQRQQALGQLFGNDAIRAASILYADGAKGVEEWKGKVNEAGYASETAAKLTDNLAGDLERLKGSLETMAIEAGGGANGGLRVLTKGMNALVDQVADLPPAIGSSLTVLAGVSGVAALAAAGWIRSRRAAATFRAELEAMGPAGERAAAGMGRLTSIAGRAIGVFAALEVAGAVIGSFQDDLNPQIEALAVGLDNYAKSGQLAGESSRVLGGDMDKLNGTFQILARDTAKDSWARGLQGSLEAIVPGLKGTDESLTRTKERIESVDQALAQMVSGGNTQGANDAFQKLASVLATDGVTMEQFRKQFPQYAASLETAGKATNGTTAATGDLNSALALGEKAQVEYKTATDAAAGAARGELDALVTLADFQKKELNPVFGLIGAQKDLQKAHKEVAKAIHEHGRSSDEAKKATENLALAAIDLEDNVGKLGGTFDGTMTPSLRRTLQAAGLTKSEISVLDRSFKDAKKAADQFDGKYEAKASAPGAPGAKKQLDEAYTAANHFAGPYRADVSVHGVPAAEAQLRRLSVYQQALKSGKIPSGFNGPIKGPDGSYYAGGGAVEGPGTGTSDSIMAYLSNGEHVWTAAEVAALGGQQAMLSLRQAVKSGKRVEVGDETPGFAAGGPVVWPFPATAKNTRIPSQSEVSNAVIPAVPSGGRTSDWIVATARMLVPGIRVLSKDRPGAMTLTGNRSYHSMGRAVDFEYSEELARKWNERYMARTKELISPYQEWNIHNGARHAYTGVVWNQHNFAGGNPHDHIAMAGGGVINEPVFGYGLRSGSSYSFGERGSETVTPGTGMGGGNTTTIHLSVSLPAGANMAEGGRQIAHQLEAFFGTGGEIRANGMRLVGN